MHLAGGAVHYKTSYQKNITYSSTEAEFVAVYDAAKMAIYLRSLLDEIGIPQIHATMIYEDNTGALMMANAGQPTRRTRHMDIRYFAIQDWVEDEENDELTVNVDCVLCFLLDYSTFFP